MTTIATSANWPAWQRILFRFFFIYWLLYIAPWTWFSVVPGISWLLQFYNNAVDWSVSFANSHLFHIKEQLVPLNGSGDTSFGWAQLCTWLLIAVTGTIIWSILSRKKEYVKLNYWLCLIIRYNIALVCFAYGFIKLLHLQMPFPGYSQLATPLGDLLPMRLSWMFMGYSDLYQGFSGAMEVIAGVLLLYRRTTTLGCLIAAGVFMNVAMLNLGYDIPVKLFSIHVFFMCMYLLILEHRRLMDFFIRNQPAAPSVLYQYTPSKKWMKVSRIVLKLVMICLAVGYYLYEAYSWQKEDAAFKPMPPLQAGVYDVSSYVINKDTIPPLITDSTRWLNLTIDRNNTGSVGALDTTLRIRYNRSYFAYESDTTAHLLTLRKFTGAPDSAYRFYYHQPDSATVYLSGKKGSDSLFIVLKKSKRSFRLAEKQFHWLSESNR